MRGNQFMVVINPQHRCGDLEPEHLIDPFKWCRVVTVLELNVAVRVQLGLSPACAFGGHLWQRF